MSIERVTKTMVVNRCTCTRCGYVWESIVDVPKRCSGCKSPFWNKPLRQPTRAKKITRYTAPPEGTPEFEKFKEQLIKSMTKDGKKSSKTLRKAHK